MENSNLVRQDLIDASKLLRKLADMMTDDQIIVGSMDDILKLIETQLNKIENGTNLDGGIRHGRKQKD